MKKDYYPLPQENLLSFNKGDEIVDLGLSQGGSDYHFEVLDPQQGRLRSLTSGDDIEKKNGHFLLIEDLQKLPETVTLKLAKKGECYTNIIDGKKYQVIAAEDEHMVKLLDLSDNQVRIHSRLGSSYYLKVAPEAERVPPMDEDGQYLLFDF